MDVKRLVEIAGYVLQIYGIGVGGTALVVERIHGYSLFRGLLDIVPRLVTPASFPLLRLVQGLMYTPSAREGTYGILNRPGTLFAYFFVVVSHVAWFLSPILLPVGIARQSALLIVLGALGLAVSTAIHALTGISQATVKSGDFRLRAAGWEQMRLTLRRHPGLCLRSFLASWIQSPVISLKAAVTILVLALAHWPAWAFPRLRGRRIDLTHKTERDRYYALVSVMTLLVGTVLLGVSTAL
jgi:hypothetical protein